MEFSPRPGDKISLLGSEYQFVKSPVATRMDFPDEREGGEGIVYHLSRISSTKEEFALKIFTYRSSKGLDLINSHVSSCRQLSKFKNIPGLKVCDRQVISSSFDCQLAAQYPNLLPAILMPWIKGKTWFDIVSKKNGGNSWTKADSYFLAMRTAKIIADLEANGLSHCDVASGNLIFDLSKDIVELIDVEGMYGPNFTKPLRVSKGTNGYSHITPNNGLWFPESDRFATAVLLSEILTWFKPEIRKIIGDKDETFFQADEMGSYCEKYNTVIECLKSEYSTKIADLFDAAWLSNEIKECPPIKEWCEEICKVIPGEDGLSIMPDRLEIGTLYTPLLKKQFRIQNVNKTTINGTINSNADWITLTQKRFDLIPGQYVDIDLEIKRPNNVQPGTLLVEYIEIQHDSSSSLVSVSGEVGNIPVVQNGGNEQRTYERQSNNNVTDSNSSSGVIWFFIIIGLLLFFLLLYNAR